MKTWQSKCGTVQLYLSDCFEIFPTIEAGGVDLIVTDPPYGHNNNNGDLIHHREAALGKGVAGPARPIANDGSEANEIFKATLPEFNRLLKPGCCCCCCCGGGGPNPQFARWSLWLDEAIGFKQMVVWDKGPMGMGWHYRRSYETVLVAEKKGAACNWQGGRKVENVIRPGAYGIAKIIPGEDDHPCAKPTALYKAFINWHSSEGELVLDPFMGHGPCGQAAVEMGRRFIGVECDEEHYERAVKRIRAALAQPRLMGV